jgi:predicted MPP superfamily phosphohydrolase
MPKMQFIIFLVIVLSVYAGMHGFVYWRIASGLSLSPGQRLALKWVMAALGLLFIAAEFITRLTPVRPLLFVASVWLGVMAIALTFFLFEMLASLLLPGLRRRLVLGAMALVLLVGAFSLANVALGPVLREKRIAISGLPQALNGFSIVQLSDLHLGNLASPAGMRRVVDRVNALNPDLVCVTGDTIDGDVCSEEGYCATLSSIRARHGVVAITGNHEFYAGVDKFLELARRSGWRVLRNQSWVIEPGLAIVGLDDDTARGFGFPGPDLDAALRSLPPVPKVLLYHQPLNFAAAVKKGISLQLSGHTHAGQIPPMDALVCLTYKYPAGLYRLGGSFIHTSTGTGTWGPPMRFLSRSEITRLVLVAAEPDAAPATN